MIYVYVWKIIVVIQIFVLIFFQKLSFELVLTIARNF
jgi:hypothetical protein